MDQYLWGTNEYITRPIQEIHGHLYERKKIAKNENADCYTAQLELSLFP